LIKSDVETGRKTERCRKGPPLTSKREKELLKRGKEVEKEKSHSTTDD